MADQFFEEQDPFFEPENAVAPQTGAKIPVLGTVLHSAMGAPGLPYGEVLRAASAKLNSMMHGTSYEAEKNRIAVNEGLPANKEERMRELAPVDTHGSINPLNWELTPRGRQDAIATGLGVIGGNDISNSAVMPRPGLMKSMAEKAAVKSTYADRAAMRRVFKGDLAEGPKEVGRFILDQPDVPLSDPKAMNEQLHSIRNEVGQNVHEVASASPAVPVDLEFAKYKALTHPAVAKLKESNLSLPEYNSIAEFFDDQIARNGKVVSPAKAHDIRMLMDDFGVNWGQSPLTKDAANAAWKNARGALNDELGHAMSQSGLGEQWSAANKQYELANKADRLSYIGAERRTANKMFSPSEVGAGIVGAAAALGSGNVGELALPLSVYAANRYGMPVTARLADWASRRAEPSGRTASASLAGEIGPSIRGGIGLRAAQAAASPTNIPEEEAPRAAALRKAIAALRGE